MTADDRRLAAMLYLPADNERFVLKAASVGVASVILDLEDSVAPDRKEAARRAAAELVREPKSALGSRWVRINRLGSREASDDLASIVGPGLEGVVVPKVETPRDVNEVDNTLRSHEAEQGLQPGSIGIIALIESARGIANAAAIAGASGRLITLGMGAADFLADLGLPGNVGSGDPPPILVHARVALVMACRVAGIRPPHDSAFLDIRDSEGLAEDCRRARQLGFRGKHAIHPGQLPTIEEAFRPSAIEIAAARRVISDSDHQARIGRGAWQSEGRMVDAAVVVRAKEILRWASEEASAES